ncbi:MAG: hypothetical protein ACI841_005144, partial [Planctomycetota bacterium]
RRTHFAGLSASPRSFAGPARVIAFSALLALAACSNDDSEGSNTQPQSETQESLRFHVVADVHITTWALGGSWVNSSRRYQEQPNPLSSYRDLGLSHWKLADATRHFRRDPEASFLVELGDLKSSPLGGRGLPEMTEDIRDACRRLDAWGGDVHHVAGNHDIQMVSKRGVAHASTDWKAYVAALDLSGHNPGDRMGNPERNGRGYYSWTTGQYLFIVLDGNGAWDDAVGELSYYNGSDHYKPASEHSGNPDQWRHMTVGIHQEQLDWIAQELEQHPDKSVIFFSHHCLGRNDWQDEGMSNSGFFIRNHEAFHRTIIDHRPESGAGAEHVICVSGHAHPGVFNNTRDGVRYFNVRGMVLGTTNKKDYGKFGAGGWVDAEGVVSDKDDGSHRPEHNSFCTFELSVDTDEDLSVRIETYDLPDFQYYDHFQRPAYQTQSLPK